MEKAIRPARAAARGPDRPAGFTVVEFLSGLGAAYVIFVVLVPPIVVISDHAWTRIDLAGLATAAAQTALVCLIFAIVSGMVVGLIGLPIALGLAMLLRPVRNPAAHLAAHAAAALVVCVGLAAADSSLVGLGDPVATLEAVWPAVVGCIVATLGGWLFAAQRARRSDARRPTESLPLV